MYLTRLQDQLTMTSPQAMVWSCAMVTEGGREGSPVKAISKQFAHRGSFSILCARLSARLGNPEDTY
jgi:hypothetical protein